MTGSKRYRERRYKHLPKPKHLCAAITKKGDPCPFPGEYVLDEARWSVWRDAFQWYCHVHADREIMVKVKV